MEKLLKLDQRFNIEHLYWKSHGLVKFEIIITSYTVIQQLPLIYYFEQYEVSPFFLVSTLWSYPQFSMWQANFKSQVDSWVGFYLMGYWGILSPTETGWVSSFGGSLKEWSKFKECHKFNNGNVTSRVGILCFKFWADFDVRIDLWGL